MSITERPPERVDVRAFDDERGVPRCGACRRTLQHRDAWRCPYLSCRAWLRTAGEADLERQRRGRTREPDLGG